MSDECIGYWYCGLDPYDDEEGGQFYFAIDLDDEQTRENPRDLLAHLISVAMHVLDHDLLDGNEIEED